MKISTRSRYGLRAMLELARCYEASPVLMNTLAEREDLSVKYLHTLLTKLQAAGMVRSIRGSGGGFILARPPAEIRLNEIVNALEGPLSLVDCVTDTEACHKSNRCTARRVWKELSETIERAMAGVTLEDLIASEEPMESASKKKETTRSDRKKESSRLLCEVPQLRRLATVKS